MQLELDRQRHYFIHLLSDNNEELVRQATTIFDESLGKEYIGAETIKQNIRLNSHIALGAFEGEDLRGVLLGHIGETQELKEYERNLAKFGIVIPLTKHKVGVVKSLAVASGYRRHGMGTTLTEEALRAFSSVYCTISLAVSWISNRPDNSQRLFESLNFRKLITIPEYWKEDSIQKGYSCPVCKEPPCLCAARFYLRFL